MTLPRSPLAAVFVAALAAAPAIAADLPNLPSLAADPETQAPDWKGFYVGAGVAVASFKGAKGARSAATFSPATIARSTTTSCSACASPPATAPWIFPGGRYSRLRFRRDERQARLRNGPSDALCRDRRRGSPGRPISAAASPTSTIRSTACSPAPARCRRWGRSASASTTPSPTISMSASKRRSATAARSAPPFGHSLAQ